MMKLMNNLSKEAKEQMEQSKVKGVPYGSHCPSPPFTTWSGLMMCAPDSKHANRLKEKCGGVPIKSDGTIYEEGDWRGAAAIVGYWTAPEDWCEMVAGREASTPCSTTDYPKQSFHPSWA
jgi:hypothetical protein